MMAVVPSGRFAWNPGGDATTAAFRYLALPTVINICERRKCSEKLDLLQKR